MQLGAKHTTPQGQSLRGDAGWAPAKWGPLGAAGPGAPKVSHSDPGGGGACLGPSPCAHSPGRCAHTASTSRGRLGCGESRTPGAPQRLSTGGGPPGSQGAPRTPAPRCPRGTHQMGCSPQAAPHGRGRQGHCCGGRVLGHRRAVRWVGRMIRGAGSRVEGPRPQGLPLPGEHLKDCPAGMPGGGGTPLNPQRALV